VQQFASLAGLVTLALSIFVGARLLYAAARTRRPPEVAMGIYQALVVGAIVIYAVLRARAATTADWMQFFGWVVVANGMIALGVVALAVGIRRIYRVSDAWAAPLCMGLSTWVLVGWIWTSLGDALPTTVAPTWQNACFVAARSSVYMWGAVESVRFHRMMRRRVALGLADPVVAHQVLMWGLFSLCMGTLAVASLAAGVILGDAYPTSTLALLITPTVSLAASICLWLGFFPPAFYRRLVGGLAARAQTTA